MGRKSQEVVRTIHEIKDPETGEKAQFPIEADYFFKNEEKQGMREELSEKLLEISEIESEKSTVASRYKSKIEEVSLSIDVVAGKIRSGKEVRTFDCFLTLDFEQKVRIYTDTKTGQVMRQEELTPQDFQLKLGE
jgi:hypothetical protein